MQQELKVRYRQVADLIPYAKNSRTHSDAQVAQIAASIREFGWTNPVLVDGEGGIVAGHGRVLAARKLKMAEVPTIEISHLTPAQRRAYVIADNKLAENAGWDTDLLKLELGALNDEGFDLSLMGFDLDELEKLLAPEGTDGLTDPDEVPEAPVNPVAVAGDVWLLGRHRLVCGDSTSADDVAKALNGVKPHLMVTDPPYGVEYDPEWRQRAGVNTDTAAKGKVLNDDKADWREAWALFPGDVAYVWHAGLFAGVVADSLIACDFTLRSQIVWDKGQLVLSRGDYHWQHEPCQPAGTLVQKVVKPGRWRDPSAIESVPIESLKQGDVVVSFGNAKIYRRGREITGIGSRSYVGDLHTIAVGGLSTRTTVEHQFTVRFDPKHAGTAVCYLMKKGERFRVGVCGLFNSRGFGPAVRLAQEAGENLWVLSAHPTLREARIAEQVITCRYGVPTTHWETDRSVPTEHTRVAKDIDAIYQGIGVENVARGAALILADFGRRPDYPLINSGEVGRFSRKQSRIVRACNIVPGIMQVPVPTTGEDFSWQSVSSNTRAHFEGPVYSMDVAGDHHYVADGIVTHNCWYAVRKTKKGHWAGDRKQTTVWQIPKPKKSETGHGTQKPVECMQRPIENNSSPGQAIYEPFSGSGTTIIACERTGRSCHAVELNPAYVDVAIKRWQDFTGQQATLDGDGRTHAELAAARLGARQ